MLEELHTYGIYLLILAAFGFAYLITKHTLVDVVHGEDRELHDAHVKSLLKGLIVTLILIQVLW